MKRYTVRNIVDAASLRDITEASVIEGALRALFLLLPRLALRTWCRSNAASWLCPDQSSGQLAWFAAGSRPPTRASAKNARGSAMRVR